jgi:hypothetical protein
VVLLNTGTYYGRYELTSYDNARKASADLKGVYYYYHDEDHERVHRAVGHTVDRWTDRKGWGGLGTVDAFWREFCCFCSVTHLLVTAYGFIPFLSQDIKFTQVASCILFSLVLTVIALATKSCTPGWRHLSWHFLLGCIF